MTWLDPAPGPADSRPAAPPPGCVAFEVTFSRGTAILAIIGDLDLNTMPLLSERLSLILRQKPRWLVVDMARTSFMDCGPRGLAAITKEHTLATRLSRPRCRGRPRR